MQERIIEFLKGADGYISGEDISGQLNISRAAIWKYMQALREEGYDIEAVPHLGYQLKSLPDKILPVEVTRQLKTKLIGHKVIALNQVTSTMDEAFNRALEGEADGTVITAEAQSKGRGRMGRGWVSPKSKGIYASIILRPNLPPSQLSRLTLVTAVAMAQAVLQVTGVEAQIKWPNDLLVEDKKLAGILTELRAEVDQVRFVIVGFGLNVNATSHQLIDTATSLKILTGNSIDRIALLRAVLENMDLWYQCLLKGQFDKVLEFARGHSATLKKRVRVTDAGGVLEGEAIDLDEEGALLVRKDNGVMVRKFSGDTITLRGS